MVFHETLAPVKGSSERLPVIAGLWHAAVADRKPREVTGAILKLLSAHQLPTDTKSYVLFQTLHNAVRSRVIKFDLLILKYFVPKHSFMATDSLHAVVERRLKQTRTILTFQELVVSIYPLCHSDFHLAHMTLFHEQFITH